MNDVFNIKTGPKFKAIETGYKCRIQTLVSSPSISQTDNMNLT